VFHQSILHLSEQNFFSLAPHGCAIAFPQHLHCEADTFSGISLHRRQKDLTVFMESFSCSAMSEYVIPPERSLIISAFCSAVIIDTSVFPDVSIGKRKRQNPKCLCENGNAKK